MPTALVLQHIAVEEPAALGDALVRRGIELRAVRIFAGEPVPERLAAEALVVMGGPMGVYERDRYPHLADELRLIEAALVRQTPILGTCLGSQLLAAALGARVYRNRCKEIGWHDVVLTDAARSDLLFADAPARFTPVHWHGDIFDLPSGAVRLARSDLSPTQAYRYGDPGAPCDLLSRRWSAHRATRAVVLARAAYRPKATIRRMVSGRQVA